jgi:hypothetical protein
MAPFFLPHPSAHTTTPRKPIMRFSFPSVRLFSALALACALSACGGGDGGGGGFSGFLPGGGAPTTPGTPDTPANPNPPAPDTGVKPEMRCAP